MYRSPSSFRRHRPGPDDGPDAGGGMDLGGAQARRHRPRRASPGARGCGLREAGWALMLPVIIIGGLRGGIFTPTEAAVVAAVYALLVSLFVYEIKARDLMPLFVKRRAHHRGGDVPGGGGHGVVLHDHAGRHAARPDRAARSGAGPAQAADVRAAGAADAGRHGDGPDAHHPDPGAGADAGHHQGRHRPGLFRRDVRHGGLRGPAHAAGGHRAERGLRRGRINMETICRGVGATWSPTRCCWSCW